MTKELVLSLTKEEKIKLLEDCLKEDRFDFFLTFSRILLDAPLDRGGLETEIVEAIHNESMKNSAIKN